MARLGPRNDLPSLYFEPSADVCCNMKPQSRRAAAPVSVRDDTNQIPLSSDHDALGARRVEAIGATAVARRNRRGRRDEIDGYD